MTWLVTLLLKALGDAGVSLALGFIKEQQSRKDIRDKERQKIALEMYEYSTAAYEFLRGPSGTNVRVRDGATGIEF